MGEKYYTYTFQIDSKCTIGYYLSLSKLEAQVFSWLESVKRVFSL